ncbi:hypothetical protein BDW02DRAFT_180140 [Decorospora gaudefroyi]|uniref:Uncharacterized protein n=1 Tax=Decorospora gaudefroyi TaxID=184978 RepID=A0A6A5KFR2_9PLEO|nr:hypothetical protein BDW02DRAFT_180140 [Decorospora gaudefroyi]
MHCKVDMVPRQYILRGVPPPPPPFFLFLPTQPWIVFFTPIYYYTGVVLYRFILTRIDFDGCVLRRLCTSTVVYFDGCILRRLYTSAVVYFGGCIPQRLYTSTLKYFEASTLIYSYTYIHRHQHQHQHTTSRIQPSTSCPLSLSSLTVYSIDQQFLAYIHSLPYRFKEPPKDCQLADESN